MSNKTTETLVITAPNIKTAVFQLKSTAPYVQHKFSEKARIKMRSAMEQGSQQKKGRTKKDPRDFDEDYLQAMYETDEGWRGIPAPAFRNAMVSACRVAGFQMTKAKLSVFVEADGFDVDEAKPLVKIKRGDPEKYESLVRIQQTTNIAVRAMWREWEADVRISYDADQFTSQDIANLMDRVGRQVGVGEGRPDSKTSAGRGWGTFEIVGVAA